VPRSSPQVAATLALIAGVVLAGGIWIALAWLDREDTGGTLDVRFRVVRLLPGSTGPLAEDDSCLFETSPWNQLVVTDADGTVVGAFWPGDGLVEYDDQGNPLCVVYTGMSVPESPYYRLTVNGQHEIVMRAGELTLGEVSIAWPDAAEGAPVAGTPLP
jgi:hypothetical protein